MKHSINNVGEKETTRAVRVATWIAVLAAVVSALGLMGGAYCDATAKRSPKAPNVELNYSDPINYRGEVRYVNNFDAKICAAALPTLFVGVGLGILTTGVLYYKFGRFL